MYQWIESETWLNRLAIRLKLSGALFNVHYWGMNERHFSNQTHKHSFFEICYVVGGEGFYLEEGIVCPLRKGTLFCSRPGVVHQIQSEQGLQLLFVAFELDERGSSQAVNSAFQVLSETNAVYIHDGDDLPPALLWRSLLRRADQQSPIPDACVPELAGSLLLSFIALFGEPTVPERITTHRSLPILLKQAKLYITDNLSDDDLSLGKVAAHLHVSPRHLSRIFATGIHESYSGYVRQQRIRKAADLLHNSGLSIKAIAEATGFGSVHYFTRSFHQLMNTTPGRFRDEVAAADH